MTMATRILRPQPGPHERFLASSADIVVYGGAAGGGKTYGLLLSALRYKNVRGYNCTVFRKTYKQVFSPGGLWDETLDMYYGIRGAQSRISNGEWRFTDKRGYITSRVLFKHIGSDDELYDYQGSQICGLCFDELTHFTEHQFFYMLSRNRSVCGVKPFVRATCNPDADSWVAAFIEWWIDQKTGYPIPERSGKIRWMIRRNNIIHWADSKSDLIEQFNLKTEEELHEPNSITFIASSVYDNKILLKQDPGYLANLKALALVEQERLLHGNWKIKPAAGLFFKRTQVKDMLPNVPQDVVKWVRAWDLAATSEDEGGDPAYTAGVLMGKRQDGSYVIADVINLRLSAADVRKTVRMTAAMDIARYKRVRVRLPQDPGQAGKDQAQSYIKFMAGYDVCAIAESGSKEARAEPVAAQWQAGNFYVVIGDWNEEYFAQLESFPASKFKDMVDATSSAFTEIENVFDIGGLIT